MSEIAIVISYVLLGAGLAARLRFMLLGAGLRPRLRMAHP